MEIVAKSKDLKEAIAKVASVINPNSIMPIYRNVYFDMSGEKVRLIGTDTETTVETALEVERKEGEESFSVDAKTLLDLLKTLPNETIHISEESNVFTLKATTGVYSAAIDKSEFPLPQEKATDNSLTMKGFALDMIVRATIQTVSNDELRPAMGGVLFDLKEDGAVFVSTNGFKLSKYQTKMPGSGAKLIVPTKVLEQVTGLQDENVEIKYNDVNVIFDWGTTKVSGRLVDGKYPPYEQVIPVNEKVVSLKQKDLVDALKRASLFADSTTKQVVLHVEGSRIVVEGADKGFNKSSFEEVSVYGNNVTMDIGFSATYLTDVLKIVGDGDIKLYFNESSSKPMLIKNVASPGLTGLVMPVMIT